MNMTRLLISIFAIIGPIITGVAGYWYGGQHAKDAYAEHFLSEAFTREYHESRHDFFTLQLLFENKTDELFQVAQNRYYNRILLAADAAEKASNPRLAQMLKPKLLEAQAFQKLHPYQFPNVEEQKQWAALINSPR